MKKNVTRFVLVLLAVLVMFPTSWASAQPDDSLKFASLSSKTDVVSVCDPNLIDLSGLSDVGFDANDPDIPCTVDVYTLTRDLTQTPLDLTGRFTCGGTVKNKNGSIIGKIWENVTVTWKYIGYTSSATRGQSVSNSSLYAWKYLWGPSTEDINGKTEIKSGGWFTYLGARKYNITILFTVDGNQSNPYWRCSWSSYTP
jgi:hypothetical protein